MHVPVNVLTFGYGFVKPSVRVCRKATIWFFFLIAQAEIAGRAIDIVLDLGHRPAVHLLGFFPGGQCPDVTGKA